MMRSGKRSRSAIQESRLRVQICSTGGAALASSTSCGGAASLAGSSFGVASAAFSETDGVTDPAPDVVTAGFMRSDRLVVIAAPDDVEVLPWVVVGLVCVLDVVLDGASPAVPPGDAVVPVVVAAVVPVGLVLAHRERLSFRKLSVESHRTEDADKGPPAAE